MGTFSEPGIASRSNSPSGVQPTHVGIRRLPNSAQRLLGLAAPDAREAFSKVLRLCNSRDISEGELELVRRYLEPISSGFTKSILFSTIVRMCELAGFDLKKFEPTLALISGNLASPKIILPESALRFLSCEKKWVCQATEQYFKKALEMGAIVETTAEIGGAKSKVYVKGFFTFAGNPAAYEPIGNKFHIIEMKMGKITAAAPAEFDGRHHGPKDSSLQEAIMKFEK